MTDQYSFGTRSEAVLGNKVHPDLVAIARLALVLSPVDFSVLEGLRNTAQEAQHVADGTSQTLHSRHLPNKQGWACAIDVAAYVDGHIVWGPVSLYAQIGQAFKDAAGSLKLHVEWGGDWYSLKDYGHFQLPWGLYP